MKKRAISTIMALTMVFSQFTQVFGAGMPKNSENATGNVKVQEQEILEKKRAKATRLVQKKRELEEEKQHLLEETGHYSDRFLVKHMDWQDEEVHEWEKHAKLAYKEANGQKAVQEHAVTSKIKDTVEQQEFVELLAEQQSLSVDEEVEQPEFVESVGEYKVIQLPEKVAPEVFINEYRKELGSEAVYIQPDYVVNLLSAPAESLETKHVGTSLDFGNSQKGIITGEETSVGTTQKKAGQKTAPNLLGQESILGRTADLQEAWKYTKGSGSIIALLDTGVDVSHPDLQGHMLAGYDFVNGQETVYDAGRGMEQAHGTHIAGILAGCAPEAKILPLKVFENGSSYTSNILEAIAYAKDQGAAIVNMSFGSTDNNQALRDAMEESGMFFVCAAGNHRKDLGEEPVYPAAFSLENSISVGAVNQDFGLAYFSNYGEEKVDIAAWGREVYSCFPDGEYGILDGTSMAAGYVSAAAALAVPVSGVDGLKKRLMDTADRLSCLEGKIAQGNKISFSGAVSGAIKEGIAEVTPKEDVMETFELSSPREKWELFDSGRNMAIGAGARHALALKEDGSVWAWGHNGMGQLGNGLAAHSNQPARVVLADAITSISAGWTFNIALSEDGVIYTWGDNSDGQLGNGTTTNSRLPVRVVMPANCGKVKKISAGVSHCMALTEDGKVWAWGSNRYGALGDGTEEDRLTPVEVKGLDDIVDISAGQFKSMALDSKGYPWVWGIDIPGHVGDGTSCKTATKMASATYYFVKGMSKGYGKMSAFISKGDGSVWNWGEGYLGNFERAIEQMPRQVPNTRDGIVNNMDQVAIGIDNTLVLGNDGKVMGWGANNNSELGIGDTAIKDRACFIYSGAQAISVGWEFSMILKKDGKILMAGDNTYGQCAQSNNTAICYYPTEVEFKQNLSFNTAKPIKLDEAMCGELVNGGECRYYSFVPSQTAIYSFETISDFDTYGILYDASGVQIAYNDNGKKQGESTNPLDFYIKHILMANTTYYIAVKAYSNTKTGSYTLKVSNKDDYGGVMSSAYDISERYVTEGDINYFGDTDAFVFLPKASGNYIISTTGSTTLGGAFFKVDSNSNTTAMPLVYQDGNVRIGISMNANEKHYLMVHNRDNSIASLGAYKVYVETPLTITIE